MDWNEIRNEYITDESTSYRKLAKKYDVPLSTLTRHAREENWTEQRERVKSETMEKTIVKLSDEQAKRAAKFVSLADALAEKIGRAIECVGANDAQSIRQLTASLRDLQAMQGIKSDADMREQEARIAKLEKELGSDLPVDAKQTGVVLLPCVMEAIPPPKEEQDGA
ncbi:MAG: hypothetical protein J6K63_00025 [Clostridia bacterium]|nr:hypothetical protein [Clostridia bacterium]